LLLLQIRNLIDDPDAPRMSAAFVKARVEQRHDICRFEIRIAHPAA
jgi:hypothetical protein